MSALKAGTAISEVIADGVSQIIDKITGALIEIVYKGVHYATEIMTTSIVEQISKNAYFIVLSNPKDGLMYYSPVAIDKNFAISVINFNTIVIIYTFMAQNARSVAQQAGNNMSPVFDLHHKPGYFDHYHRGDIPHEDAISHVFFGLPQF